MAAHPIITAKRRRVIEALKEGTPKTEIAAKEQISRKTVRRWQTRYEEHGEAPEPGYLVGSDTGLYLPCELGRRRNLSTSNRAKIPPIVKQLDHLRLGRSLLLGTQIQRPIEQPVRFQQSFNINVLVYVGPRKRPSTTLDTDVGPLFRGRPRQSLRPSNRKLQCPPVREDHAHRFRIWQCDRHGARIKLNNPPAHVPPSISGETSPARGW